MDRLEEREFNKFYTFARKVMGEYYRSLENPNSDIFYLYKYITRKEITNPAHQKNVIKRAISQRLKNIYIKRQKLKESDISEGEDISNIDETFSDDYGYLVYLVTQKAKEIDVVSAEYLYDRLIFGYTYEQLGAKYSRSHSHIRLSIQNLIKELNILDLKHYS